MSEYDCCVVGFSIGAYSMPQEEDLTYRAAAAPLKGLSRGAIAAHVQTQTSFAFP